MDCDDLLADWSGARQIELAPGFPGLELTSPAMRAVISLYGAQLLEYSPSGQAPLLYLSPRARFEAGRAIRGGVPLCWPWFGANIPEPDQPAHGVARLSRWALTRLERDGTLFHVELSGPAWRGLEPVIRFELGDGIGIRLSTLNRSDRPLPLGSALHSYFAVGDARRARVTGMAGRDFDDKVTGTRGRYVDEPQCFGGEVDRIVYTGGELVLRDPDNRRRIRIATSGSASAVIWNPGAERCAAFGDLEPDAWTRFVCIETANAGDDVRRLDPGENHTLGCRIRHEPD
ncbi:D-hexose-6-phosphate mutarotase [Paludibacterium paludis]|uniref:Putative glucose-6-phosphate 1-epimerase n=1 Tax=Paludibacterium paludis TaxID=1225769 RepID=A0A918P1P4_9NEIS|nr:D-hexose-6-phosphate mutarotase [Paludibacterium paludis]GGY12578.1 hypothetical protein GCM10011289_14780 [Paludibacterium paludis]